VIRREAYVTAVALLCAMAVGSALILAFGEAPARVYALLLARTWGDLHGVGQVLFKATPLIFTGLSVALAFRVGLFNIGAEGQMIAGAFATGLIAAALPGGVPAVVALPVAILAGALAGGAIGAIPGVLKVRYGAHEVINTIMLNFIVGAVVLYLGNRFFFVEETTRTAVIAPAARLPGLGLPGSPANLSLALALGVAGLVWYFFARSRRGYEWRAVGLGPAAAEAAGISRAAAVVGAMTAAGALAGLVGSNLVLGYKHYFEEGTGAGVGFMGIAVALLGRNHPGGVVAAALLLATLSHGGLAVSELVPKELFDVLQAVIILAVVAASAELRRRWPGSAAA
jgi:general nucleoside transport system permease protein